VRYELGFYIAEYGILHSHRRENLKSYKNNLFHFPPQWEHCALVQWGRGVGGCSVQFKPEISQQEEVNIYVIMLLPRMKHQVFPGRKSGSCDLTCSVRASERKVGHQNRHRDCELLRWRQVYPAIFQQKCCNTVITFLL
jgi:hypothetical protein